MDVKSQDNAVETTASKDEKSLGQKIKEVFTGKKEETSAEDVVTAEEKIDDPEDKETGSSDDIQAMIDQAKADAVAEYKKQQEEEARKAKLTPEELKAEEDAEKDKKINDLEHQLMVRNCQDEAVKFLDEKKLPVKLAEILNYESKETADQSLKTVAAVFTECLENAVKERLRGRTPTGLNSNNDINQTADMQAKIYEQMGIKTDKK